MSFLSGIVSDITSAVTDPGKLVGDTLNAILPDNMHAIGDLAAAAADFEGGNPLAALSHAMDGLKDLPQLLQALATGPSAAAATPVGTAAAEPSPPPLSSASVRTSTGRSSSSVSPAGSWRPAPAPAHHRTALSGAATASSAVPPSTGPLATPGRSTATAASKSSSTSATSSSSSSATNPADLKKLLAMSPDQFMQAVSSGKLPADVANSPSAMMQIQAKMNQITQMNQLVTSMMAAQHQMQMSIIQNIRV